jgi:hypothetical protein
MHTGTFTFTLTQPLVCFWSINNVRDLYANLNESATRQRITQTETYKS